MVQRITRCDELNRELSDTSSAVVKEEAARTVILISSQEDREINLLHRHGRRRIVRRTEEQLAVIKEYRIQLLVPVGPVIYIPSSTYRCSRGTSSDPKTS